MRNVFLAVSILLLVSVSASTMRNLRDVLISYGLGNQLQGWQLHRASAISYDGSAIAGYGASPNGLTTAFRATLP